MALPMKPRQISTEALRQAVEQSKKVDLSRHTPKSRDEENFPLFKIPTGKSYVYVPNIAEDGGYLRYIASKITNDGKFQGIVRSPRGLVIPDLELDGSDLLSEARSLAWDVYNQRKEHQALQLGVEASSEEAKKAAKSSLDKRNIHDEIERIAFPVVLIELEGEKTPKTISNTKCYWLDLSLNFYRKVWLKAIHQQVISMGEEVGEGDEESFIPPNGRLFSVTLPENKNARDAMKDLLVFALPKIAELGPQGERLQGKLQAQLDKEANEKGWTPAKATETIISANLYHREDYEALNNDLVEKSRAILELLEQKPQVGTSDSLGVINVNAGVDEIPEIPAGAFDGE